jgi:hypothetical protein
MERRMRLVGVMLLLLGLGACVLDPHADRRSSPGQVPAGSGAAIVALQEMLLGTFTTAGGELSGPMMTQHLAIAATGLPGPAFYSQINTGGDRRLYRQRINVLVPAGAGRVRVISHALVEPARFAADRPLPAITSADLKPGFEATPESDCSMIWQQTAINAWRGRIDAGRCRIVSARRGTTIGLEAEAELDARSLRQTERGIGADGSRLFGTAPGVLIELTRQ